MSDGFSQQGIRSDVPCSPPGAPPDEEPDRRELSPTLGLPMYPVRQDFSLPVPRRNWTVELLAGAILGAVIGGFFGIFAGEWPTLIVAPVVGITLGMVAGIVTGLYTGPGGRLNVLGILAAMGRIVLVIHFLIFVSAICGILGVFIISRSSDERRD